jgi:hypothetical protein
MQSIFLCLNPNVAVAHGAASLTLRRKSTCKVAPADFSAFVHWNCIDNKNLLWRLPAAQLASAKFQKIGLTNIDICDDARGNLLISQRRFATKHNRLAHAAEAQQMRFHFRRIHFFSRDIDYVGNAPDDAESPRRFG